MTHFAEADALLRAHRRAVGEALALGIPVVRFGVRGVPWKSLGDLRSEIRQATA